jgi:hypothetical protein
MMAKAWGRVTGLDEISRAIGGIADGTPPLRPSS